LRRMSKNKTAPCGCGCLTVLVVIGMVCLGISKLLYPDPPEVPAPTVRELMVERENLQAQYDQYSAALGADSESMRNLKQRIEQVDREIEELQS